MQEADLVINARWVVPVEPAGVVLEKHAVVIQNDRIAAILPAAEASAKFVAAATIDRPSHALIPGLVNAHTHAAMTLFRGLADDLALAEWLEHHIWPAEMRWAGAEFVRDGTELAAVEMLRGGTTCFNDMYFFPDVAAQAAIEHGIRATVGMILIEQPTAWAQDAAEYFDKGLEVHDRFRGHALIDTAFAPHAPYSVAPETMQRLRILADELEAPVHMHVHETAQEVADSVGAHGQRPLVRLDELGLVNAQLAAVHMTQIEPGEIELLAERSVSVIHCPESNMKLASGFCPVARLLDAGVNVALGTDGAGSNNDLDMLAEMRTAALLGKAVAADAAAVSAQSALAMATINGARALGRDAQIGSVAAGKLADLVCIDLSAPASQPVHNVVSQLVYSACRDQVSDVWVGGKRRVADARLLGDRETDLMSRVDGWRRRLGANGD